MHEATTGVVARDPPSCLNCGRPLGGRFCSGCGQRAIGAYPTVAQMVGDAWHELSGYDGRFVRTFARLLRQPGALTIDVMEGRRARYIGPIRLYLLASLVYFVGAAAVPNLRVPSGAVIPGSEVTIRVDSSGQPTPLSPEQRQQAVKALGRAPWWLQPVIRPMILDPAAFRSRFLETLPRILFALVPVFAGIVAMFYRRRPFTQHLIFAIHFHTVIFLAMAAREVSQLSHSLVVLGIAELAAVAGIVCYGLMASRAVYGEGWMRILVKSAGIAVLYGIAGNVALLTTIIWAAVAT